MTAQRASQISLSVTIGLVAAKLAAGWVSGAISVLAEGLQSIFDILISLGVLISIRLAAKPPDDEHPYGHGKAEVLMSAMQMLLLVGTAGFIFAQGIGRLMKPTAVEADLGLAVMLAAGSINFGLSYWLASVARKTQSEALKGEVLHLRGDAWTAAGIVLGLALVKVTGEPRWDAIAAILFAVFILVSSLRHLRELLHPLMDGALAPEDIAKIETALQTHPEVRGYHALRTRQVGSRRVVHFHLLLDDDLTFVAAHRLAEEVEEEVRKAIGGGLVSVHYEPANDELQHQREAHSR